MKITSVELHPAGSSDVHVLSFRDPTRNNPYNVVSITGLDADSIIPKYYGVSANSDELFYNLSIEKREPQFRINLNPEFSTKSYSDLRDDLYKTIGSSRTGLVQVQFKNGTEVVAAISGWVTKLESELFDRSPYVLLGLTADDPMLTALDPVDVDITDLDPAGMNLVDALSTAPHGFNFVLAFTGSVATLTITDPGNLSWSFGVSPAGGFLNGDILHLSSDRKKKELYVVRGGVDIYLADKIVPGSVWPVIFPGSNNFAFSSPAELEWTSISYYPTYWGV